MTFQSKKIDFKTFVNLLDNFKSHVSIIGRTDTGKTTVAKMLHKDTDLFSIFFNTQDEDVVGQTIRSWSKGDLKKYIKEEKTKFNFIPDEDPRIAAYQLKIIKEDIKEFVLKYGDRSRKRFFLMFVDEAHEIAYQGSINTPLHWFFKNGIRHWTRAISMTQSPADLSKAIVRQAEYHVIFDVNDFESQYFKHKNIPIERVQDMLMDSHNFTIYVNKRFLGVFSMDL